jgi:hypothetical protein
MTEIRDLTADDIPAVAKIFQKVFRNPKDAPPPGLIRCMNDLFFEHPWRDPEISSKVYVTPEGVIGGYIGVIPLRMNLNGRVLRAAAPTTIAVAEPARNPFAGAQLLRTFLNGKQDISVSEPINPIAIGMWEKFGARAATSESMEWLAILRPASFALTLAEQKVGLLRYLKMFGAPLDKLVARDLAKDRHRQGIEVSVTNREVLQEEFIPLFLDMANAYDLRPDWDAASLKWQLDHASGNVKRGPLHCRMVQDSSGKVLGAYVYHAQEGGIAWIVQLLTTPEHAATVVDSLLTQTKAEGCVAAKGRSQARLVEPLLKRRAMLFRRHSAIVHARDESLVKAVHEGRAITSGFAGETWTRLVSDRYS